MNLPGAQELLVLVALVVVLSATGLWPKVLEALRALQGEPAAPSSPPPPASTADLDVCYQLLGIAPSATLEEIERAYRRKAKLHHPDRGGDDDAMRALNEAYTRIKQTRKPV